MPRRRLRKKKTLKKKKHNQKIATKRSTHTQYDKNKNAHTQIKLALLRSLQRKEKKALNNSGKRKKKH
jgi:hypothetical protein